MIPQYIYLKMSYAIIKEYSKEHFQPKLKLADKSEYSFSADEKEYSYEK